MKIRIKGNSLRLRLTKTEVDTFGGKGYLEERTEFGDNTLIYALEAKSGIDNLTAGFTANKITLWVPAVIQKEWVGSDVVGYNFKQPLPGGGELFLLLEKDFVCLDATFEDQSDNYPNPNAHC